MTQSSRILGSLYVSEKLHTYPSHKPTLTLTSHSRQNVGLGEKGGGGSLTNLQVCCLNLQVPVYAAFLYDAVYQYAVALEKTLARNETPDGLNIISKLLNKEYHSKCYATETQSYYSSKGFLRPLSKLSTGVFRN